MEVNLNYWGEFIFSLLVLWWLYAGILVIGIIAFIGSDKFVRVISVLLIILVLSGNILIFRGYLLFDVSIIYAINLIVFITGIILLLIADDNKTKENLGTIITVIAMFFMLVNDFAEFRPCISLITIGIVLLVANQQTRKKIALLLMLAPIMCYLVGFVSFVFLL